MPRLTVAVGCSVAAILALSACSAPVSGDVETSPATVAWAGQVCTGVADVRSAVKGIADGLSINPLRGTEGLAEARGRIDGRIAEVQSSIDELRARIAAAPDDPAAQEARASLDAAVAAVETASSTASSSARAALDAESIPSAVSAAAGALGSVRDALSALGDLIGTATGAASGTSAQVKAAFDRAPECQDLG